MGFDAIRARFGDRITITRGKEHEFLGIEITLNDDGTASLSMPSYIESSIKECGLEISRDASTPATASLFYCNTESPTLNNNRAETFCRITMRLLYVALRTRSDILLAINFLCSRLSAPTEQDEGKLKRLLQYLTGTIRMKLTLGADRLSALFTWVDASFAVHDDMRSHTGGAMSFGRGALICRSKKQSLNTKSSTEAEVVGASDYLPNTIYAQLFMEAQGYPIQESTFYQDNESAIRMEKFGRAKSAGQRSHHINIRYFYITDHIYRQSHSKTPCTQTGECIQEKQIYKREVQHI